MLRERVCVRVRMSLCVCVCINPFQRQLWLWLGQSQRMRKGRGMGSLQKGGGEAIGVSPFLIYFIFPLFLPHLQLFPHPFILLSAHLSSSPLLPPLTQNHHKNNHLLTTA